MRTIRSLKQMAQFQLKGLIRNRTAFFFGLILPIALMLVFGSAYNTTDSLTRATIGLVDLDKGQVAQTVRQALDKSYDVTMGDEATLKDALSKGTLKAVVVLPQGLSDQVATKQVTNAIRIMFDPISPSSAQAQVQLQQVIAGVDTFLRGAPPAVFAKPETVMANEKFNVFDFLMPGQIAYMLLSSGLVSVSIALAQQRQSGTLRHLFSTPLSVGVWLSARVLANLMMTVIQVVVLYGVAVAVFKLTLPVNLFGTAVVLVISAMMTLGMGLVVGALVKSVEAAFPIAMILYMTMSFLGNAMMPLDGLSPTLQGLTKFVPTFYMTHSLKLVMMQGKGLGAAAFDLAILLGVASVTMGIAMWQIRKQLIET